jgi:hypothetical protein
MYQILESTTVMALPWAAESAQNYACGDPAVLLDVTASALHEGGDPRIPLAMLSTGLRIARSCLPTAAWQAYCRQLRAHPLGAMLRQDPITARSAARPRGYAGDAVMLDMIYGEPILAEALATTTELGRVISALVNGTPASVALRERRAVLAEWVDAAAQAASPTILAVASGHLREAEISQAFQAGAIGRWVALDQDELSCAEVANRLGGRVETVPRSITAILKGEYALRGVDLAYAAGLYDYLPQPIATRLTKRMVAMLRPGGRYCFANYAAGLWDAGYMESAMDWQLILRTPDDMAAIAAGAGPDCTTRHWSGIHGAVHYCEITRQ